MIQVASYRGGKTLFDKITRRRTNGERTHSELIFFGGISFSSSQWDGGARFKEIEYDLAKWDITPIHGVDDAAVLAWCRKNDGKKYDWRGILGLMVGKKDPGATDKLFCSEACTLALQAGGGFKHLNASETTPEKLWAAAEAYAEGWAKAKG
jgi:hypothetical protein